MAKEPHVIVALVHEACKTEDKSLLQLVYEIEPHEEETGDQPLYRYLAIEKLTEHGKKLGFRTIHDLNTTVPHKTRLAVCRRALESYGLQTVRQYGH